MAIIYTYSRIKSIMGIHTDSEGKPMGMGDQIVRKRITGWLKVITSPLWVHRGWGNTAPHLSLKK